MHTVTRYVSATGREFDTAAAAMADEDRLPADIADLEGQLAMIGPRGTFAGTRLSAGETERLSEVWTSAAARLRAQWGAAQAQRLLRTAPAPSAEALADLARAVRMLLDVAGLPRGHLNAELAAAGCAPGPPASP